MKKTIYLIWKKIFKDLIFKFFDLFLHIFIILIFFIVKRFKRRLLKREKLQQWVKGEIVRSEKVVRKIWESIGIVIVVVAREIEIFWREQFEFKRKGLCFKVKGERIRPVRESGRVKQVVIDWKIGFRIWEFR